MNIPRARRNRPLLLTLIALSAADFLAAVLDGGPQWKAQRFVETEVAPGARIEWPGAAARRPFTVVGSRSDYREKL
jgi:hypothetical protein